MHGESWDSVQAKTKKQHERLQAALVEFLNEDLTLAFTFLQLLQPREGLVDKERVSGVIAKVQAVLDVVRRLEGQIEDEEARKAIQQRSDELQAALDLR
jgi:hypothetical protein